MSRKKEDVAGSTETITDRIKLVRLKENFDQRGMAGQLRVEWTTYYKYETGERRPGWNVLHRMVRTFNLSFDWLLLGKGEMYFNEQVPKYEMESKLKEMEQGHRQQLETLETDLEEKRRQALETEKESASAEKKDLREQVKGLTEKLKDQEPNVIPGLKPEVKELVQVMDNVPMLYYEIMLQFQRFKVDNENLISAAMNAAKKAGS